MNHDTVRGHLEEAVTDIREGYPKDARRHIEDALAIIDKSPVYNNMVFYESKESSGPVRARLIPDPESNK